jgi:hypothetical protein
MRARSSVRGAALAAAAAAAALAPALATIVLPPFLSDGAVIQTWNNYHTAAIL